MIGINFNNPDKAVVARNLLTCLKYDYQDIINYFEKWDV
jgi:hypothetical protein